MPGSTLNWSTVNIPRGQRAELWAKLAVPGAGARLTLHTDFTPESVANPSALHVGRLAEGAELQYKTTLQHRFSDEFDAPFDTNIDVVEARIVGVVMNALDTAVMEVLMPGVAKATGTGYEELAFGGPTAAPTKYSFAVIWRMPEDPTKVAVFQLYSALNNEGFAMRIRRGGNGVGSTPIALQGFAVSTRAAGDQVGKLWKQVA